MQKRMRATRTHGALTVSRINETGVGPNPLLLAGHEVDEEPTLAVGTGEAPRSIRFHREGAQDLVLTLYVDKAFLLGRGPQCNVVFPDDSVSREHARLS